MNPDDIDYKLVSDMLLRENEALKIRIAENLPMMGRISWSPDFNKLTRWISDPMHLYGIFIGLCIVATILQIAALVKEIRE